MEWLMILPAAVLYTIGCGFVIHLVSDRHNRYERRRVTRLYNGREAIYRVRNPE